MISQPSDVLTIKIDLNDLDQERNQFSLQTPSHSIDLRHRVSRKLNLPEAIQAMDPSHRTCIDAYFGPNHKDTIDRVDKLFSTSANALSSKPCSKDTIQIQDTVQTTDDKASNKSGLKETVDTISSSHLGNVITSGKPTTNLNRDTVHVINRSHSTDFNASSRLTPSDTTHTHMVNMSPSSDISILHEVMDANALKLLNSKDTVKTINTSPLSDVNVLHTFTDANALTTMNSKGTVHTVTTSQGLCMVMSAATTIDHELSRKNGGGKTNSRSTRLTEQTEERSFECEFCGKLFGSKSKIDEHKRTHTGEKPFKCDLCSLGFCTRGNLKKHRQTHSGNKPFKCELCYRGFKTKGDLQSHIRFHTGERPYQCDLCRKAFAQNGDLQRHMRTHTGEKPYECNVCQKSFSDKGNMLRHERIHTGEKLFKCDLCGKAFGQTNHLNEHVRTHTGEKPFSCYFCGKSFGQSNALKEHLKRIHFKEKSLYNHTSSKTS